MNLQRVDSLRFHGVCIDRQITLKDHITYLSNKLSKSMAIIYRASHVLDTNTLYCLYDTIFEPHLNYCIEVWVDTYETISTQYLFYRKKLFKLSVMLGHWTILLKCFVNLTF